MCPTITTAPTPAATASRSQDTPSITRRPHTSCPMRMNSIVRTSCIADGAADEVFHQRHLEVVVIEGRGTLNGRGTRAIRNVLVPGSAGHELLHGFQPARDTFDRAAC